MKEVPSLLVGLGLRGKRSLSAQISPSRVPLMMFIMGDGLRIFVFEYTKTPLKRSPVTAFVARREQFARFYCLQILGVVADLSSPPVDELTGRKPRHFRRSAVLHPIHGVAVLDRNIDNFLRAGHRIVSLRASTFSIVATASVVSKCFLARSERSAK